MKKTHILPVLALASAVMFSFTGCFASNFRAIDDEDDFYDALDDVAGIDEDDTLSLKNFEFTDGDDVEYYIRAVDGDNYYVYVRFEDDDDAMDWFDDYYQSFDYTREEKEYKGTLAISERKTIGSAVFDCKITYGMALPENYVESDAEIYGGVYVKDNCFIAVYSKDGSKRDKEKIKNFLKAIGYPKP